MRGSKNPENDGDRMCEHCGLFYSVRGIIPHERNCDRDEPLLPLDRHDDQEDVDDDLGDEEVPLEGEGEPEGSGPPDDVGDGASPGPVDGGGPSVTQARTDGGLGLEGPPDIDETPPADEGETENSATVECPANGCDTGSEPDDLEDGKTYRCPDCGELFRWSA